MACSSGDDSWLSSFEVAQARAIGPPRFPPELFADAVEDRLPQIRVQRAAASRLELPDPLKRLKQGFLDKVVGIADIARPSGSRPEAQRCSGRTWRAKRRSTASWSPARARSIR